MTPLPTVRPFSNGIQFAEWQFRNCDQCSKRYDEDTRNHFCDIERALSEAYVGDGTVSESIGTRMGAIHYRGRFNWPCLEWEAAEDAGERCRKAHEQARRELVMELPPA